MRATRGIDSDAHKDKSKLVLSREASLEHEILVVSDAALSSHGIVGGTATAWGC